MFFCAPRSKKAKYLRIIKAERVSPPPLHGRRPSSFPRNICLYLFSYLSSRGDAPSAWVPLFLFPFAKKRAALGGSGTFGIVEICGSKIEWNSVGLGRTSGTQQRILSPNSHSAHLLGEALAWCAEHIHQSCASDGPLYTRMRNRCGIAQSVPVFQSRNRYGSAILKLSLAYCDRGSGDTAHRPEMRMGLK